MVQPTAELPSIPANTFYERLDRALTESCFGNAMRTLCEPYYESDRSRGGRPGIDPEVYFKMQLIGFFEGLPSERGIAAQYADSLSIRKCLHYELHEATPGHSTLTVVRQRLGPEVFDQVFKGRQANSRGVEGPNSRLAESAILAVSR